MAQKPNHKCVICGAAYYACNDCDKHRSWRAVACTPECYQTYLAFILYRDGNMSDEDFKQVLVDNDFEGKQVIPELTDIFANVLGTKKETKRQKAD